MAGTRLSGLMSGMDTESIISQLMEGRKKKASNKIIYQGRYNEITWTIDEQGTLNVVGKGEFKATNVDDTHYYSAPWEGYESEIVTAIIDLEDTTDLSQMFYLCNNLNTVSFVNADILYIENMQGLFAECENLKEINWGKINTSNVKNANAMFCHWYDCLFRY